MKLKNLKNLINRTRSELHWKIINKTHNRDIFEITSDPVGQTHTIHTPSNLFPKDPMDKFYYLHELAHATLCESVHPCFATNYYAINTPESYVQIVHPIFLAATDWFIEQWLMENCPDLMKAVIEEHYIREVENLESGGVTPDFLYKTALTMAQRIIYLRKPNQAAGQLLNVVNAFLSVKPNNPTHAKFETLINLLVAPCYTLRLSQIIEDQIDVWQVCQISESSCKPGLPINLSPYPC